MSQQDDNELDKAFRSSINKMRLVPPPIAWDGVRAAALQQQLLNSQAINGWLKLLSAILGVAFIGSIYFYESKNKNRQPIILPTEKTVAVTKTDTIYITKAEKVYVPVYQQNVANEGEVSEAKDTRQGVDNDGVSDQFLESQKNNDDFIIDNKTSEKRNEAIIATDYEKEQFSKNQSDTQDNHVISQASKEGDGATKSELNSANDMLNIINAENLLSKKFTEIAYKGKLPHISTTSRPPHIPKKIVQGGTTFDWSKISLESYYSKEINMLTVKTETTNGQLLKEQNLANEYTYGIRAGLDITPRWSIFTGIELFHATLAATEKAEDVIPDSHHDAAPSFPHPTPLGTGYIPNDGSGNKFMLKTGDHQIAMMRIPLLAKYYFYDARMSILNSNYHDLRLYFIGGGYWDFSLKQTLPIELSTPNGQNVSMTLTAFDGVQKNTYGLNLGIGAEYNFMNNWSLYLEPSYKTSITPIVIDQPLKTFVSGYSINGGLKFRFGR